MKIKRSASKNTIFLVLLIFSCSNGINNNDIAAYIAKPRNNLIKEVQAGSYNISVRYMPAQILFNGNNKEERIKKDVINDSVVYFILSMMCNNTNILSGISDQYTYSILSQTLSFSMHKYVKMYYEDKELELMDYQFSQIYTVSPTTDLLFAFKIKDKLKRNKKIDFILDDFGINMGQQKFTFNTKDIIRINKRIS